MLINQETTKTILNILIEAGTLALTIRSKDLNISEKKTLDFVTEADIAVQNFIINSIQRHSELPFISEEKDNSNIGDSFFILDPIDGTSNFIAKNSTKWGISLALVENNIPIFGAIYLPAINCLMHASRNSGTYVNGQSCLLKNNSKSLSEGFVTVEIGPWLKDNYKYFNFLHHLCGNVRGVTAFCSSVWSTYEVLLQNSLAYFNFIDVKTWDSAASWILINEAGGCTHAFDGKIKWNEENANTIYASNSELLEEAKSFLAFYK